MNEEERRRYIWAPYVPGLCGCGGAGPKPDPVENYTSPFMEALVAEGPPEPLPVPEPEVKVVYVRDHEAQDQLDRIRDQRWTADWEARRDARRAVLQERGWCSRHMVPHCRDPECQDY